MKGVLLWLISVFLTLCSYSDASGYMGTLATMWGATCALEASSLKPICNATTASYNDTNAPNGTQFWTLSGGVYFGCGLSYKDRTPICWGDTRAGNTLPSSLQSISYSNLNSGGYHACAVRADESGIVDCWGNNYFGQSSPVKGSYSSVTLGLLFTCGLSKSDSLSVCWGRSIIEGNNSIADPGRQYSFIYAGLDHMCGIEKDTRKTWCWGDNSNNQSQPPSQYNFSAITAGNSHTCGIREDNHEAVCWGGNSYGQLNVGSGIKFSVISAGDKYTCGVRLDQPMAIYCWGEYDLKYSSNISVAPCQSKCNEDQYEMDSTILGLIPCPNSGDKICLDCSRCANGSVEASACGINKDRTCAPAASVSPSPSGPQPNQTSVAKSKKSFPIIPVVAVPVSVVVLILAVVCLVRCLGRRLRLRPPNKVPKQPGPWENTPQMVEEFSYRELSAATRGYNATMFVGKGSFGMVYKGVLQDRRVVAIKKSTDPERSKSFDQELKLLARLHHAYLVNLIGFCKQQKVLVFEFMENGSLFDCVFVRKDVQLDWITRIRIAAQAARGLEYLHTYASPRIIHRDVKAANILLDKEWNAHVADFGLSMFGPTNNDTHVSNMTVVGTPGYLDPEYFYTFQLTVKSDVYSFGILMLELLTGKKAITQEDKGAHGVGAWVSQLVKENKLLDVFDPSLQQPQDVSPIIEALHLGLHCIRPSGKDRPIMTYVATSLETCLEHLIATEPGSSTSF